MVDHLYTHVQFQTNEALLCKTLDMHIELCLSTLCPVLGHSQLGMSLELYRRSGNFRVKKLSYDKFSCKNFFVGTTFYHVNVNSAH